MKTGVRTSPCAVRRTPVRAAPSVARTSKTGAFEPSPVVRPASTDCDELSTDPWKQTRLVAAGPWPVETSPLVRPSSEKVQQTFHRSQDEHRVAEGVEAVALLDREGIETARLFDAREGHHE